MRRCRRRRLCNTGRVTVGYYILRDGVLTMTDDEGAPVRGQSGEKIKIQQKLKDGEDATVIAKCGRRWQSRPRSAGIVAARAA
jgi:hypothetical protein